MYNIIYSLLTSHKLQPLNVSMFGPFQCVWIERCKDIVTDLREEMPFWDFVKEYMAAYVGFPANEGCAWCRGLGVYSEAGSAEW